MKKRISYILVENKEKTNETPTLEIKCFRLGKKDVRMTCGLPDTD